MSAKKILIPYDFNQLEIQNARTHNLASAPGSPVPGQYYFDTILTAEYYWNGTEWVSRDARKRTGIPLANLATDPLARANHTGSQTAATISDLASTVKAYKLSEFAAPTASVPMNGQKMTGLADPSSAQDAATKNYVDGAIQSAAAGIDCKASVRAVANSNITLSGAQTIDGVSVVAGDRVLCRGQSTASQNGVYVCAAGAWSRATDADANSEITPGAFWFVEEGTTYGKTQWRCENSGAISLGTTSITINQFGGAAAYSAGNGMTLVGNEFAVGAGTGITVTADAIAIDTAVVVRKVAATIGDGASTSFTVTHNLNNQDVMTQVRDVATNKLVEVDVTNNGVNTVVIDFAIAPALNSYRVVVQG